MIIKSLPFYNLSAGGAQMGNEACERNLRVKMRLQVKKSVTLVIFRQSHIEKSVKIYLPKGLDVTLINETPSTCATTERIATGPTVKVEETRGVNMEDRWIGKALTVPAQHLRIHPDELD